MKRKQFLKALGLGSLGLFAALKMGQSEPKGPEQLGFNHLPADAGEQQKIGKMKTVLHKANSRGHADHGWLDTYHSFSFANYYNPERMGFGALRVLNDDKVAAARGFGRHPHDNMEIISIPLSGDLEHQDSMGNVALIQEGDLQVMSAGTGVFHSEKNKKLDQEVRFLQIWLLPNKKNVAPRYDQIKLDRAKMKNNLLQVLSPSPNDEGVWVHQDAWFHLGHWEAGHQQTYNFKRTENGLYIFVLEGQIKAGTTVLDRRDGLGVWNTQKLELQATKEAKILLMEVPMH